MGKRELLHVAQGVAADQVPAKDPGLWNAWIARGRPEGERLEEAHDGWLVWWFCGQGG